MIDVAIIGGGAAGLMAAIQAASCGGRIILIEKEKYCGKKLRITGKGRCNLTNDCDLQNFLSHICRNSKFLYSALTRFSAIDAMNFFEELGVPLKVERGNRVFPRSDHAQDVVDALWHTCNSLSVIFKRGAVYQLQRFAAGYIQVKLEKEIINARRVIIATGGLSYPLTGSTGDGYRMAASLGHKIISCRPSLVPMVMKENCCKLMQGLTLKNVKLSIIFNKSKTEIFSQLGEMIFTHFGISGPLVLQASAHLEEDHMQEYRLFIDLKPGMSEDELHRRIIREILQMPNCEYKTLLKKLLPQKMISVMAERTKLSLNYKLNQITKKQRIFLVNHLKRFALTPISFRPIDEAIVTRGGVDVRQVSPSTMESKLCKGLYFAGEVLDIDGYTGGFNLQVAWTTGYIAGRSAMQSLKNNHIS